ncbi:MAG: protein-disulfide reductase DsbD family protein [Chlamydiota bacterium]|nr:protein-disulfide reductase DsbD family protein [Chlamydiota bacterium]
MKKIYFYFLIFSILSISQCLRANIVKDAHVEAQLISEDTAVQPGRDFWIALRLKMDEGWHTYWKNPGDSGLPIEMKWNLPDGFRAGPLQWPYPLRIEAQPLLSYGYKGEVFLLAKIIAPQSTGSASQISIGATIRWLACKVECVPGKAELHLDLPVTDQTPDLNETWARSFSETRAKIAVPAPDWDFFASLSEDQLILNISSESFYPLTGLVFFSEDPRLIDHAAVQLVEKTLKGYRLSLRLSDLYTGTFTHVKGVLFSNEGWRGPGSEKALALDTLIRTHAQADTVGFWYICGIMLMAIAGGIILNLMPCVLPVLSLKIMHFINLAGDKPRKAIGHAFLFSAGVISCFWILGLILLLLRALGEPIGWGYQLQSPVFLVVLSFLFFILAFNCYGVFNLGAVFLGSTDGKISGNGTMSSILSGMIATIVATPCTAPFMGSALGFGLTQTVPIALGVFTCLGVGMSFPYLLLSCMPGLVRFVPKPGPWMFVLKESMGFLFMATVLWLLWVLSRISGLNTGFYVFFCLWFTGIGIWIYGCKDRGLSFKKFSKLARLSGVIIVIISFVISVYIVYNHNRLETKQQGTVYGIMWERFSQERLHQLLDEGRPVFIDFTAEWCLTCKVNEALAFNSDKVKRQFRRLNIAMLKADWTHRDEEISRALAYYGRSSIPLYVLYDGMTDKEYVILPEILTPDIVLEALKHIGTQSIADEKDI